MSKADAEAKPRRSKAEQRAATVEQILDAAEHLFALSGLLGVTLKDVAQRVGVHTSLLHYYFEDKTELFDRVISRRVEVVNRVRLEALDRYEREAAGQPTVEGVLHAFLDTNLDLYFNGDKGWRDSGVIGAQMSNTPGWGGAAMDKYFDPVVLRLIEILKQALPGCAEEDLFWGYHFVTGALMLTLGRTGRIDKLSGGLCASEDVGAIKARMARFMAAGFHRICAPGAERPA